MPILSGRRVVFIDRASIGFNDHPRVVNGEKPYDSCIRAKACAAKIRVRIPTNLNARSVKDLRRKVIKAFYEETMRFIGELHRMRAIKHLSPMAIITSLIVFGKTSAISGPSGKPIHQKRAVSERPPKRAKPSQALSCIAQKFESLAFDRFYKA